jgi:EAL domain-containing protein (putative c-di-GMP-specific phosphodiesterase class I)
MENMQKGINQIAILAEHGVKTAIDDFGTGYSSLAYLRKLPVSILKIDRSFIEHIDSKEQDRQLASTVVAMANNFNLDVVAEGIETDAQLELVKAIGCDYAQGFLISKPVDKNSFAKLLQPAHTGESVS